MTDFFLGIGASIIAALILATVTYMVAFGRTSIASLRFFWRVARRMRDNGVINFFSNRSEYTRYRENGTIREYLKSSERDILYVGFWFAHGVEMSNIGEFLSGVVNTGKSVRIVLLNPSSSCIDSLARYLNTSKDSLISRLEAALKAIHSARAGISPEKQNRFELLLHDELITASAFILDMDNPSVEARILVDYKIYGSDRDNTYGIEFRQTGVDHLLSDRLISSYARIAQLAVPYDPR